MSSVPERSAIDPAYRWDLDRIYTDIEDWETDFATAEEEIEALAEYEAGDITDADSLHTILAERDSLHRRVETVVAYAKMDHDEDTRNQEAMGRKARAKRLASRAASARSFLEPAIQQFDRETIDQWIKEHDDLDTYEHYLDDVLRLAPHTRSPEVESVLAELSDVTSGPADIYNTLSNADLAFPTVTDPDGEDVEITPANFTTLQRHPDRAFRQSVYEEFYSEWETVRNTVGTALATAIQSDVTHAEIRDYGSAREKALSASNVPGSVYDTLLETVQSNLDALHRHNELKRSVLDVDQLAMWDVYVPMAQGEGPTIEWEEATDHVVEALGALGEDYQERVVEGIESRWIDVYENQGKRSGAYSGGTYDTQPYILMNYQDDISSMYTLAHELGHSLHSEYTSEHQPYVYSDYDIFVAEVASTVNEVLLTHHLLETVDDEVFCRHVLNEYLERFRSTFYRQTMFAAFEDTIHETLEEGGALTPEVLDSAYRELKEDFYPEADVDDHIAREWMRIPHFYWSFYVYQYATGISSAVTIARRILDGAESARESYLSALQLGGSAYPVDVLSEAGVDVTDAAYLKMTVEEYRDALDTFEATL